MTLPGSPQACRSIARIVGPRRSGGADDVRRRDDDLVPWSNNEYLHDLLPKSEIHPLDAGHFAWEQAADEYGRLVVEWVSGGYRRVGGA